MPWAASECIMPTWMAPKLPPPANTRAVLAGPAWSDRDKVSFAPGTGALAKDHAAFAGVYSSGRPGCAINIGCGVGHSATRESVTRNLLIVVPAKAGPITTEVCRYTGLWPQLWQTCLAVAMGPGSRPGRRG